MQNLGGNRVYYGQLENRECKIKFNARIKLNHNIHVYISLVIAVSNFHSRQKSQQIEMTVCSITVNMYLLLFVTEV